jgi:H+/Cl- antiporter ClcA
MWTSKIEKIFHIIMWIIIGTLGSSFLIAYLWTDRIAKWYEVRYRITDSDCRTASTWFLACAIASLTAILLDILMLRRRRPRPTPTG